MQEIISLENLVKGLKIRQSKLTVSINTLKSEKETLEREVEKIREEKILAGKEKENKQHSRLLILSSEKRDKEQQISTLNKEVGGLQKELGEIELLLAEKRSLSKTIIQEAKAKAKEIVSTTEQIREQNDNLEATIQSNKHLFTSIETDIKSKEVKLKGCAVELRTIQTRIIRERETLQILKKQVQNFEENKPNVLYAERVIRDVQENKLQKDQLGQEINQLKDKKGALIREIELLTEDKEKVQEMRQEIVEIKGALIEKETGLNQRVAFLKDMYGELNLPW